MADGVLNGRTEFCYRRDLVTGQYCYVSPQPEMVVGMGPEVVLGIISGQASDYVHPDDRELFEATMRQLSQEGVGRLTHELRVMHRNNDTHVTYVWIRHAAEVITDDNGSRYVDGVVANITENKLIQAELRGLRLRYEHLWKQAGAAICQSRFDGRALLSCNERLARLLGYESSRECIENLVPSEAYVDPDCRGRLMAQLANCTTMEGVEIEFRRPDGAHVWLRLSFCRHASGEAVDIVAADITVKKLLSPCETEILKLLMAGLNNKEIANRLSRSLRTVENHRAAIMLKLGVKTSIELAKRVVTCELD
jgi:PAS domain S-box-containing protein